MHPALRNDDIVLGWGRKPRVDAIVLAEQGGREIIKRVQRIDGGKLYLVGDNRQQSTDSRHYGNVSKSAILGTIMITLPAAINPPKPVKPYAVVLGRIAAVVLVVMALVHLFRIDTFIPLLDGVLPGNAAAASIAALVIVFSEVFAIPFVLRMKLSLLAHIVSGALVAFAPLWWMLITIWTLGIADSTGQLGEFVTVPSVVWVLALNVLWVVFSYFTLYALGYNRLSVKRLLSK